MVKGKSDHSMFYKWSKTGIIWLVVYVDDIVITGNDTEGILSLKSFLHSQFQTKDLGPLKYFLGIEVMKSKTGKLGTKPCNTPMIPNLQLTKEGELFEDPERYRRLVGKLNYLTVTRPDIAYPIGQAPKDRRSTTGYCVFFGGNLVSWKSKKQSVVSRSSAESEYRAMAQSTSEVMWIHNLLYESGFKAPIPAKLWCDNQSALHIASNPVFHEQTMHIEIDCHFVREKIQQGLIST
ncbi:PREDICTED: uncharacterized protein LOC109164452 [Ipomoea nil]|uniref:uncharacterized protein LOC109164452 n=1 Tax=Ipomoea nil TaxID=35883 RepID=UPI0009019A4B|nr:PREDICTED: uncharacterized protein LOC109164452 [Ipomoea nil]